eukprot:SAG22_NODE_10498_length_531_cov_1.298611_1_plen_112_part_01
MGESDAAQGCVLYYDWLLTQQPPRGNKTSCGAYAPSESTTPHGPCARHGVPALLFHAAACGHNYSMMPAFIMHMHASSPDELERGAAGQPVLEAEPQPEVRHASRLNGRVEK